MYVCFGVISWAAHELMLYFQSLFVFGFTKHRFTFLNHINLYNNKLAVD